MVMSTELRKTPALLGREGPWRCRLVDLALSLSDLRDIMEVVICVILLFRGKYNNRGRIR